MRLYLVNYKITIKDIVIYLDIGIMNNNFNFQNIGNNTSNKDIY